MDVCLCNVYFVSRRSHLVVWTAKKEEEKEEEGGGGELVLGEE